MFKSNCNDKVVIFLKKFQNIFMLLMIVISIMSPVIAATNVSAVATTSGTSSSKVTKVVQEAVSSSLPTKQSNSILQQSTSTNNRQSVKQDSLYEQTTSSKSQLKTSPYTEARNMLTGNIGSVIWTLDPNVGNLHFSSGIFPDKLPNDIPWRLRGWEHLGDIKSVTFGGEIQAKDVTGLFDGGGVGIPNLTTVEGMPYLKGVTHYDNFFSRDKNLTSIDATAIDFSETLTVNSMFFNCDKLRSVGDTTNWNISKITSLGGWFMGCTNLSDLNTTNWNTSQVTNMSNTFFGCSALQKLDVANWDVSKVTTLSNTFASSGIVSLNVKNWDTRQVANLNATFSNDKNLTTLDVSNWDTGNVTDLNSTFTQDSKLTALNVSNWDTKNVTTVNSTFANCSSLKQLDVSQWNTSNVTTLDSTFSSCHGITQLDVSNWKTDNVTNMYSLFANTGVIELNMANWNTAKVTDMRYMFSRMTSLVRAYFTNWDTSQVTDMNLMFNGDKDLSHIRLGPKFKFLVTDTSRPALPNPSTETPYYGKWQRHDVTDNPVGYTYTSAELMAQYDGIKVPVGDYYWAISTPPTIEKLVRNVTNDGSSSPFKTETTGKTGDKIQYQITVTQPTGQKLDRGAVFQDILDYAHLSSAETLLTVNYLSNGIWGGAQVIPFEPDGKITLGKTAEVGMTVQFVITTRISDDSTTQIDNRITLLSGNYGAGTTSNTAVVHIIKPTTLTKSVKNETTKTDWAVEQDVGPNDQLGFKLDYQNTTGTTNHSMVFRDPLRNNELTYKPNSLTVTYQDGTTETISAAVEAQFVKNGVLTLTRALASNESVSVTFSAIVNPLVTTGTVLHNCATISADNVTKPVISNTVDMRVTKTEHQLTIRYVALDEDLSQPNAEPTRIASMVTAKGLTGKTLSTVLGNQKVAPKLIDGYTIYSVTEDSNLNSANWEKAYRDDPQFSDQDRMITYGYKKAMLTINAPDSWNFGEYNTKQSERTYYLNNNHGHPQTVTVMDNYGVQNWELQLSQAHPFIDECNHELTGAKWEFSNGNVQTLANSVASTVTTNIDRFTLAPGERTTLMTMTKSGHFQTDNPDTSDSNNPYTQVGRGSWAYRFGDQQSADYSIGLNVPVTTKRYVGRYHTKLTWSLSVGP